MGSLPPPGASLVTADPGRLRLADAHTRPASGTPSSRPRGRAATAPQRVIARRRRGIGRELLVFAAIGVVSTAAYGVLYVALRSVVDAPSANAAALLVTAIGNTAANRRLTFGVRGRGRASMLRDQAAGLAALGIALAITTGAVTLLGAVAPTAGRLVELVVLVAASAFATVVRFVVLRAFVARPAAVQAGGSQPGRELP